MTQSNPNRQRNDDVRRERGGVGVYDDNEHVDTSTTPPVAGTYGTDPTLDRTHVDTRATTEPTTYGTTEPARRAGSSIVSWIVIAIIAIIILWLVFAFLL